MKNTRIHAWFGLNQIIRLTNLFRSYYGRDFLVYYIRATEWIKQDQEPHFINLD